MFIHPSSQCVDALGEGETVVNKLVFDHDDTDEIGFSFDERTGFMPTRIVPSCETGTQERSSHVVDLESIVAAEFTIIVVTVCATCETLLLFIVGRGQ
jgi:hypothetical protein